VADLVEPQSGAQRAGILERRRPRGFTAAAGRHGASGPRRPPGPAAPAAFGVRLGERRTAVPGDREPAPGVARRARLLLRAPGRGQVPALTCGV